MESQAYGSCKFCGAKNVKSPKTGKIFCSEKCWLKQPGAVDQYGSYVKPEPDWDAIRDDKANGLARGAAFNKAVDVTVARYNKGDFPFDDFYSNLQLTFDELKEINK